jgi:hypothetical protein
MLAEPAQNAFDMAIGNNYCCTQCSSNLAALDGVVSGVTQFAVVLEAVTGYHVNDFTLMYSPRPEYVPATPQLPRNRRWWLPIDSDSDDSDEYCLCVLELVLPSG